MKTTHLIASALIVSVFAAAAQADIFTPAAWSTSLTPVNPSNTSSTSNITNPTASSIKFEYEFVGPGVYQTPGVFATFSNLATQDGPLTLDWNYSWFHAYFQVSASLTFFTDGPNGVSENQVYQWNYYGPTEMPTSGTVTLDLHSGYSWGLRVGGRNEDANYVVSGNVTLTETPAPGALALVGAAGLMGSRRRRG
jgi:MYXO-CTERM domain-containing protein